MNIYLVSRTDYVDYDEYVAAIVSANSEGEARKLWPGQHVWRKYTNKFDPTTKERQLDEHDISSLEVQIIGTSFSNEAKVILSDYKAG